MAAKTATLDLDFGEDAPEAIRWRYVGSQVGSQEPCKKCKLLCHLIHHFQDEKGNEEAVCGFCLGWR